MLSKTTSGVKKKPSESIIEDPECPYRIFNILSYFFILVLVGIPIWWYTTRVYRADLPLDEMNNVKILENPNKHFGIPLSLEYDVLITIANPDPANLHVELDGEEVDAYLKPFLNNVSTIANFTVKSQWLYLVNLAVTPRKIDDHYAIEEDQLPHLITPLEKRLWSHLSARPCLNLVLYVSHCNAPVFIYNKAGLKSETNAFLSPRWGGMHIVNPDVNSCGLGTFHPNVRTIASTFVVQLQKMLRMNDLESLQRSRAEEMLESTRRTLKSLAQLLSEINSIVISDDVALRIQVAVENAKVAQDFLDQGRVVEGLNVAKVAFLNAEAAFSDPSLLALLYFPDDQKYAVYIPLFLPVMIPVLMSLITVKKWYTELKKKAMEKKLH